MHQEYRDRVKRHLAAGGDPKYVNVKRKSEALRNRMGSEFHGKKASSEGKHLVKISSAREKELKSLSMKHF